MRKNLFISVFCFFTFFLISGFTINVEAYPPYKMTVDDAPGGAGCGNPICMDWVEEVGNGKGQKPVLVEINGFDEAKGKDRIHGVYITAGQYYLNVVDLEIPGRGFPYRFERKYKSQVGYDGPLGFNWDFNYNMRLTTSGGDIYVVNGLARKDLYTYNPDGSYTTPPGLYNKLIKNANGTFTLREFDGTRYNFTAMDTSNNRAFLSSIVDRNQNQMAFDYDSQGRISIVHDTLNRPIQYFYDASGHLDHITDFYGRTVIFQYDARKDLVGVTTPVVTGTPNGNDFPSGKTTKYTYSFGFSNSQLNHNLLTITQPNEVALDPDGPPVLANTYGTDSTKPYELDKILTQTFGGLNAASAARSLAAAGGTLNYFYEALNPTADPNDLTIPRNRTTIIDRNGDVSVYEHNIKGACVSYKEYTGRVNPNSSRATLATLIPSNNPSFPPIAKMRPGDLSFYEMTYQYNTDGELIRVTYPEGNSEEYVFDTTNPDIFQRHNLLEVRKRPGPRGGDGSGSAINDIVTKFVYEPLFNQVQMTSDPRGLDTSFVPPVNPTDTSIGGIDFDNDGTITSQEKRRARYTTVNTFDYQEGTATQILNLAASEGVSLTSQQAQRLSLGNTIAVDVNNDGLTNQQQGNIVRTQAPVVQLAGGGTQNVISLMRYNSRGQILAKVDPDQSVDEYKYYPQSNPHGAGGIPADADTVSELGGYLGKIIKDTTTTDNADGVALNITTENRYDPVGNIISTLDGRGVRSDYSVNQLNQIVRITRAADVSASPETNLTAYAYTVTNFYDYNGNLISVDVQNKDGDTDANPILTTTFAYDILDDKIEATQEVSPVKTLTTKLRYDANQNLVRSILPLNNYNVSVYDERDLLFTTTLGADNPSISSTVRKSYYGNQNVKMIRDAEDTDGVGGAEETNFTYDGFDRLIKTLDPVGNEAIVTYDPVNNALTSKSRGRIGGPSPTNNSTASNVDLTRGSSQYDELSRKIQMDSEWFIPTGVAPTRTPILGDGHQITTTEYDAMSRVKKVTNDNNHTVTFEYDGVDRVVRSVDPLNNEISNVYDNNSNVVQLTTKEHRGDDLLAAPEIFVAKNRYDSLNRLILTVDNLNQARRMAYDSRNNITQVSDAQGPVNFNDPQFGLINRSGNTTRYFYDGLNRKVKVIEDIRLAGSGNGLPSLDGPTDPNVNPSNLDTTNADNPDGKITESYTYDDDSRLQSVSDDKGNTTSYQYDSLNRKTLDTFADTTTNIYVYDLDSNLKQLTDENGSVFSYTYDALNRKIQTSIARAAGITGTTLQTFQYDGLSRPTQATDNDDPVTSADDSLVTYFYDSLSRKIEEKEDGYAVTSDYDGAGNRNQLTYPNNRVLTHTFDALERLKTIHETAGDISTYSYIGPGRVLERAFLNGTKLTYQDNSGADVGYDGLQRIIRHRHETAGDSAIADFAYGFNRENNRTFEKRLHQPIGPDTKGEAYSYDSLYRLINFKVGTQNSSGIVTTTDTQTDYNLDGVGNRTFTNKDSVVTNYSPNNMNEYDTVGGAAHIYDDKGNLKDDNNYLYIHDALNRLIDVRRKSDNSELATYTYDALNRRVTKAVTTQTVEVAQPTDEPTVKLGQNSIQKLDVENSPQPIVMTSTSTTRFLWDGWQEIEERDGVGALIAQYVYGSSIDEILAMDRGGQRYYYHDDSLGSIEALTDNSGGIVERTTYDAYGSPQFADASFTPISASTAGNPFLYTAQRFDLETGLYYYRNRYYSPTLGRFIERDPKGYDAGSLGLYEYVGGNVMNTVDPMGLADAPYLADFQKKRGQTPSGDFRDPYGGSEHVSFSSLLGYDEFKEHLDLASNPNNGFLVRFVASMALEADVGLPIVGLLEAGVFSVARTGGKAAINRGAVAIATREVGFAEDFRALVRLSPTKRNIRMAEVAVKEANQALNAAKKAEPYLVEEAKGAMIKSNIPGEFMKHLAVVQASIFAGKAGEREVESRTEEVSTPSHKDSASSGKSKSNNIKPIAKNQVKDKSVQKMHGPLSSETHRHGSGFTQGDKLKYDIFGNITSYGGVGSRVGAGDWGGYTAGHGGGGYTAHGARP